MVVNTPIDLRGAGIPNDNRNAGRLLLSTLEHIGGIFVVGWRSRPRATYPQYQGFRHYIHLVTSAPVCAHG